MAKEKIIPVILCGGAGVRLWPLSRPVLPKQFLKLGSSHTMFQDTLLRCSGPVFDERSIVVAGAAVETLCVDNLAELGRQADIILEPMGRDSCAAVVTGCLMALRRSPDALVLILAADHRIDDIAAFVDGISGAADAAAGGKLVTFGITPDHPATGYGYIQPGDLMAAESCVRQVKRFVEKPNAKTAAEYVEGGYLWNSGNFLFRAQVFLDEVKAYAPAVLGATTAALAGAESRAGIHVLDAAAFGEVPKISVDYAVIEKTSKAAVYPVAYQWNDIGSWDALQDILPKNDDENCLVGLGAATRSHRNLVHSEDTFVALIDVDDVIVIVCGQQVLVTKRGCSGQMKELALNIQQASLNRLEEMNDGFVELQAGSNTIHSVGMFTALVGVSNLKVEATPQKITITRKK